MGKEIKILNTLDGIIIIREGNAGVYRKLAAIDSKGVYKLALDPNATYREYVLITLVPENTELPPFSSDDIAGFKAIVVRQKQGSSPPEFYWEGDPIDEVTAEDMEETTDDMEEQSKEDVKQQRQPTEGVKELPTEDVKQQRQPTEGVKELPTEGVKELPTEDVKQQQPSPEDLEKQPAKDEKQPVKDVKEQQPRKDQGSSSNRDDSQKPGFCCGLQKLFRRK